MKPKIISILLFILITSGVQSFAQTAPTPPNKLLAEISNGSKEVLFHGYGTEPDWTIYLTETELYFSESYDTERKTYFLKTKFDKNLKSQTIIYINKEGKKDSIIIKKEPSNDGMSDRTFPYSVLFQGMVGCGDAKLMSKNWLEYNNRPNAGRP
jgi:uncharacterized membrane protein